jgi:hypothetical protein
MKNLKPLCYLLVLFLSTSCITISLKTRNKKVSNYEKTDDVKNKLHKKLLSDDSDVCDMRFLLEIISKRVYDFEKIQIDEYRINKIKENLIKTYNIYKAQDKVLRISEDELKLKLSCYLDYMLDPNNKEADWFDFFSDDHFRKFNCK